MIEKRLKSPLCYFSVPLLMSVTLSMLGLVATPTAALASGNPAGNIANPMVRAVDLAKPAVVRILTSLNGHLTVHFTNTQSASFPQNGGSYKLQYSGSGTFISAHGDILTADHVVKPPKDQSLDDDLYAYAAQDVANYINQTFTPNPPYTSGEVLSAMESGYFRTDTHYDQPTSDVYPSTDFTGTVNNRNLKSAHIAVDKIEAESQFSADDIAIIHINMDNTPSVQFGNSDNIEPQDELTIIGYPGNGDVSEKREINQFLVSSVNKIYVSALKKTDTGSSLIQVGGNVEHGDSGGPAIDSNGNIVGIVSFYSAHASTPVGTSFLRSGSTAETLAEEINLNMKQGTLEKAWQQAFADYTATTPGHWHKAQKELTQILTTYSAFQGVAPYLYYAAAQANSEKLPQPVPAKANYNWIIILCSSIVALLLIAGIVFFVVRGRNKKSKQETVFPTQAYPQQATYYNTSEVWQPENPETVSEVNRTSSAETPGEAASTYVQEEDTATVPAVHGRDQEAVSVSSYATIATDKHNEEKIEQRDFSS